jgi:hypothetical protein
MAKSLVKAWAISEKFFKVLISSRNEKCREPELIHLGVWRRRIERQGSISGREGIAKEVGTHEDHR